MPATLNAIEVASRLGVHPQTVRIWIKRGKLPAEKVGREWRIAASQVDEIAGTWEQAFDEYRSTSAAAECLNRWRLRELAIALAETVAAAEAFATASGGLEEVLERAAPVVIQERLETLLARLEPLSRSVRRVDLLRAFREPLVALRAEACRMGREVDGRMGEELERQERRVADLHEQYGDDR